MRTLAIGMLLVLAFSEPTWGKKLLTNSIQFDEAPDWLTESQLNTTTRRVENFLEWDTRRVKAFAYTDAAKFAAVHGMGPRVVAFFRRADATLHLGPEVNAKNFDPLFAHEVVHVIFFQKYKQAIPKWLEEGLANYVGRMNRIDYPWLRDQSWGDVRQLEHPYRGAIDSRLHYAISTALIEMIAAKCSLSDLLHLSVGRNMENYLSTYCGYSDLNASFKAWVDKKAKENQKPATAKK